MSVKPIVPRNRLRARLVKLRQKLLELRGTDIDEMSAADSKRFLIREKDLVQSAAGLFIQHVEMIDEDVGGVRGDNEIKKILWELKRLSASIVRLIQDEKNLLGLHDYFSPGGTQKEMSERLQEMITSLSS